MELDDNIRFGVEEYKRAIYRDIERRYPSYNVIETVPRMYRCHHSLDPRLRVK